MLDLAAARASAIGGCPRAIRTGQRLGEKDMVQKDARRPSGVKPVTAQVVGPPGRLVEVEQRMVQEAPGKEDVALQIADPVVV